jgi:hypothetical protein
VYKEKKKRQEVNGTSCPGPTIAKPPSSQTEGRLGLPSMPGQRLKANFYEPAWLS